MEKINAIRLANNQFKMEAMNQPELGYDNSSKEVLKQ